MRLQRACILQSTLPAPLGLFASRNGVGVAHSCTAKVVDGGHVVAARRFCKDDAGDVSWEDEANASKEVNHFGLVAVLGHGQGLDGQVAKCGGVDEVLCGHIVAIVLRVCEGSALRIAPGQVVSDARAAIRAILIEG